MTDARCEHGNTLMGCEVCGGMTDQELADGIAMEAALTDAFFGPQVFSFAYGEIALLHDCVAGELARLLMYDPGGKRFEDLIELGRRIGMEL